MYRTTLPRRILIETLSLMAVLLIVGGLLSGCSSSGSNGSNTPDSSTPLAGKTLNIYCGAGMTNPFTEIADAFQAETGCTMNVTFANAAQIQTQINTTGEGDYFIAGSTDELKPVEDSVAVNTPLVKHIPVIAVPTSNTKDITGLNDLEKCDTLLIGDPESTPIGKIAKKALGDAGIWDSLSDKNAFVTTTTAPQIASALASGEGDAGIVWKENVKADGSMIVTTSDLDGYIKVIPAARLKSVGDTEAADAFDEFLQTQTAKDIWEKYGYELA